MDGDWTDQNCKIYWSVWRLNRRGYWILIILYTPREAGCVSPINIFVHHPAEDEPFRRITCLKSLELSTRNKKPRTNKVEIHYEIRKVLHNIGRERKVIYHIMNTDEKCFINIWKCLDVKGQRYVCISPLNFQHILLSLDDPSFI